MDFELEYAVIRLHDITRLIEEKIGIGELSQDIRKCADRLSELSKVSNEILWLWVGFRTQQNLLDSELNVATLGWKAGEYFKVTTVNGRAMLVKVDPLEKFLLVGKKNNGWYRKLS